MAFPQLKHVIIPAHGDKVTEEELNRFLRGHQILDIREEFVENGQNSCWCIAVRYAVGERGEMRPGITRRTRVDYKDELEPEAFVRFTELRNRRKIIADEDSLPAFAVFTDEELAGIARLVNPSLEDLGSVKGIGEKKLERFGKRILGMAKE